MHCPKECEIKMMLTELSYVLGPDMPKWPTNPSEKMEKNLSFEKGDGCNASSYFHHMHNGTHVDAPGHFSPSGCMLEEVPIEDFFYTSPLLLDLPKEKGGAISLEDLKEHEAELQKADIVCLYLHSADVRESTPQSYTDNFPVISVEGAKYLRENFPQLKAIAIDVVGVDSPVNGSEMGFPVHKALLDGDEYRRFLIFEDVNLKKLAEIKGTVKAICAFPVRWQGAEAGPVNMVAISE